MLPKLPRANQQACPLVCSPPEVRMKILHDLLVHDGPLRARKQHDTPSFYTYYGVTKKSRMIREMEEEVVDSYNLHPAVLSTCQIVYDEGRPLLYGQNTLGVQICDGCCDGHDLPYSPDHKKVCGCGRVGCEGDSMFVYCIPRMCLKIEVTRSPASLEVKENFRQLFAEFENVHLDINCDWNYDWRLKWAITDTAELFESKNVHVKFIHGSLMDDLESAEELLHLFTLWRCEQFKALNWQTSDPAVSLVAEIITSDRPVVTDYKYLYKATEDFVFKICPNCSAEYGHRDCHGEALADLGRATWALNPVRFFRLRDKFFADFEQEVKEMKQIAFEKDHLVDPANLTTDTSEMVNDEATEEDW